MLAPRKESYNKPREHIQKQRYHFANKGPCSQSYSFYSSLIEMWELGHKEGWAKELMLSNCGAGEDSWEFLGLQGDQTSQSERKSILNIHWKDWYWSRSSSTLATWWEELTSGKDPDAGKNWGQEKEATEDEMVGWHHRLSGHEFEQTLGHSEGQGSLACFGPWGHKESDMTKWLNNNKVLVRRPNKDNGNPVMPLFFTKAELAL